MTRTDGRTIGLLTWLDAVRSMGQRLEFLGDEPGEAYGWAEGNFLEQMPPDRSMGLMSHRLRA